MDRALDHRLLGPAVGFHPRLPDPTEVRKLLAEAEISLFIQQAEIDQGVLNTGWYLQAIASARPDLLLYELSRQRAAHKVSGHIFDLALKSSGMSTLERLRYTFAAQVGYMGGELTPNAAALARSAPLPSDPYEWSEPSLMALESGVLLLSLNRPALYPLLSRRRAQLDQLESEIGDLADTVYAGLSGVIRGVQALTNYLTYGRESQYEQARWFLEAAIDSELAGSDIDSRWVAVHLHRIVGDLATRSVWAALPRQLQSTARAMTLGDPPVLTLWPPQLSFLAVANDVPSPLNPSARRLVLSFPTSAGKTLLAQILILSHIASSSAGDVCVVAPTHSLCRELSRSLDQRLRVLGHQLYQEAPLGFARPKPPVARVSVMTPEKLAAMLRADPASLLDQYTMFVVDEAHLVADESRGWRLEETMSFLHYATRYTDHRIVILSAALGNQAHFIQWMTHDESQVISRHEDWRGPRRLHAIYTNKVVWKAQRDLPPQGRKRARREYPQRGVVTLKVDDSFYRGEFTEDVGVFVQRENKMGDWVKDNDASTLERQRLVPLIEHVAASGPVLIVQPTRSDAQKLAEAIATVRPEGGESFALYDLSRLRLGQWHPLTQVLAKGVAFHHSTLPIDIQVEIEDAVRAGRIKILVATSTLIEGVNLPFKTVIIGRRGYVNAEGETVELIDAPKLLNAIGRAGRAGRETEGWMILAEQSANYDSTMFKLLERTSDDLNIRSTLTAEVALAGIAAFEAAALSMEDAIFVSRDEGADGFLSFIWFIAQAFQDLNGGEATLDDVVAALQSTLVWQQLERTQRESVVDAAVVAIRAFDAHPPEQRKRWAYAGTSLPTARVLNDVAEQLLTRVDPRIDLNDIVEAVDFVLDEETLHTLLGLRENDRRGFKRHRSAPSGDVVPVDYKELLMDWVSGVELQELADDHLAMITDEGYRADQLAEFCTSVFEHHLPWTLGIVLQWVNTWLDAAGADVQIPDYLPSAIQYGVSTLPALYLMIGGIRSRRLANAVASRTPGEIDDEAALQEWLGSQTITDWRQQFDASPTELVDLLAFVRAPEAQFVTSVLEGMESELQIVWEELVLSPVEAGLQRQADVPDPAPIQVVANEQVVGTIRLADYNDVALLMDIGVPLSVRVSPRADSLILSISLAAEGEAT